jgi:hypothetical protein
MSTHAGQHSPALADLADITAEVAAHVGQPLIAACPFARRGQITQKVAGKFGMVAYLAARQYAKAKASGLPEHFFLAVTEEHVHAVGYKIGLGGKQKLGEEVAVWRREDLQVEARPSRLWIDVTLASPAEDERVECRVGAAPAADAFVQLLQSRPVKQAA